MLIGCSAVAGVLCLLALCIFGGLFASAPSEPKTAADYIKQYGGSADVYNRILSSTDCIALQADFDQADANLKLHDPGTALYKMGEGYMAAADNRMKAIGCYKSFNPPTSTRAFVQVPLQSSATSYILPTLTHPAQSTNIAFETATAFIVPTNANQFTSTALIYMQPPTQRPTKSNASGPCSCSGDVMNCTDFSSQSAAQACYDFCVSQGVGDINKLDRDHDGLACEG